jgi:hypothetical protein
MKIIIFCILHCIIACSYAQLEKYYSVNIKEFEDNYDRSYNGHSYDLKISLCKDGNYEIWLVSTSLSGLYFDDDDMISDEIVFYYYISDGGYEIKNDTLFLTDSYTHYQMVYKFDTTCVYPVKTFPFLKNKIFSDISQIYYSPPKCSEVFEEITSIEEKVSEFRETNIQENLLTKGSYWFHYKYEIKLSEDNKYELILGNLDIDYFTFDLLLFSGTWKRDGNILYLWDTNFEHQFYGLIRKDGIEFLFNRWWNDWVLKKNLE